MNKMTRQQKIRRVHKIEYLLTLNFAALAKKFHRKSGEKVRINLLWELEGLRFELSNNL